jgi:hypothetical protein
MLVLTTAALPQLCRHWRRNLGRLITPRHYPRLEETAFAGFPWAADNDALNGFDEDRFLAMVETIATGDPGCRDPLPGCLFVAVPDDVRRGPDGLPVASAEGTLELFERWHRILAGYRLPLALVLQNGQEQLPVPWRRIAAVFVGGDTAWKLGAEAAELVAEAKRRGKHVHMGRVNSRRRARYAASIGCDSVDGTGASRYRDRRLPQYLDWAAEPAQLGLTIELTNTRVGPAPAGIALQDNHHVTKEDG